jgi:predicted DNA binding CopG/RHH family protein
MAAKPGANLKLPRGLSPDEEAQWWEDHWDDLEWTEANVQVVPPRVIRRSAPVDRLRLPVDVLDALKRQAEAQGTSHQRLIRAWLEERLAADADKHASAAAGGARQSKSKTS